MIEGEYLTECHCIPGHRSSVLTHRCQDCDFPDCDYYDGKPVPPCPAGRLRCRDGTSGLASPATQE